MSNLKVIISGGGTGGHIFPAIAIAGAVKKQFPDAEILFVGAKGKMEMEKVPEAGYKIVGLPIRGIQRKLDFSNLKVPFLLIKSLWISYQTIKDFKPNVVIGVGGYASAAVVFTASFMGIKTLIQEQNSYPGITNKILSKRADIICVAFDGMEKFFPKNKLKLLGNPIRQDILSSANKRAEGYKHFGLNPDKMTLLAAGGSLGAKTINQCVLNLIPYLDEYNLQVIWQCGKGDWELLNKKIEKQAHQHVQIRKFIKEMDLAYACCDLIISRAGAISISEITALQKVAILIPSPNVAEDHQTKNARALSEKKAAILLRDQDAVEKINDTLDELIQNQEKLSTLKSNLSLIYRNPNAAEDIVGEIKTLAEL